MRKKKETLHWKCDWKNCVNAVDVKDRPKWCIVYGEILNDKCPNFNKEDAT